jgi:hypothetical protein
MVEFTFLKENTEILEDGREATRRSGGILECFNNLVGSEDTLRRTH